MMRNATITTESAGIDISADSLQVRVGWKSANQQLDYSPAERFTNDQDGFRTLYKWVSEATNSSENVWFVMEATGVYYEELAYFLDEMGANVCVLVPTRAKHYAKSLPVKSKTDKIDARVLARYGLERRPRRWQPTSDKLRQIKALLRERQQLKTQRTQLKNRLHAARKAWKHPQNSIRRMVDHIRHITDYITEITAQLEQLWTTERQLADPIRRITQITGVGASTVLTVVAETNGFALVTNRNQLASYSGLDVVLDESGDHQGPTAISKQGNAHIRRAMYMPALSAIQHNKAMRTFYRRLMENYSDDQKKKAVTAVMRKLLLLIYSLWKSGQTYNPDFHYQQIIRDT